MFINRCNDFTSDAIEAFKLSHWTWTQRANHFFTPFIDYYVPLSFVTFTTFTCTWMPAPPPQCIWRPRCGTIPPSASSSRTCCRTRRISSPWSCRWPLHQEGVNDGASWVIGVVGRYQGLDLVPQDPLQRPLHAHLLQGGVDLLGGDPPLLLNLEHAIGEARVQQRHGYRTSVSFPFSSG